MNSIPTLRLATLCLGIALSLNAACRLSAAAPAPTSGSTNPATSVSPAPTPEFSRLVDDLRTRATSLTKWLSLRSALKSIGYSKDDLARTKDALRNKSVSLQDADLFCARWQQRHQEAIEPRQLLTVLKQLLEGEAPLLAGKD